MAHLGGIAVEHGGGHTAVDRALRVDGEVIDEEALLRLELKALAEAAVYLRLGLDKPLVRGDERPVKEAAGGDTRPVFRLAQARIGEEVYVIAVALQLLDQLIHPLNGHDGAIPKGHEAAGGFVQMCRYAGTYDLAGLLIRQRTAVELRPFERQEHLAHEDRSILRRNAVVLDEVAAVKADENAAHVKNDILYHQTILTFPLVRRNTISSEMMVVTVRMVARAAAVPSLMRVTS